MLMDKLQVQVFDLYMLYTPILLKLIVKYLQNKIKTLYFNIKLVLSKFKSQIGIIFT